MFAIDNSLIQIWVGSFVTMVVIGVIISVWGAWRTITRQRSQLQSVNAELDMRVTELSEEIIRRQQAEKELAEQAAALARADEVRRSRLRIITAQESLRREIAQQLHGSVQNRLILLTLQLKELEKGAAPKELSRELGDLREKFEGLLENEIRSIVHQLYPYILRRGFIPELQSLGDQFESVMAIEMDLDEELARQEKSDRNLIPEQAKLAAYRIAEEALTNVAKHAGASKVKVRLDRPSKDLLRLVVTDDGRGFTPDEASSGMGLVNAKSMLASLWAT